MSENRLKIAMVSVHSCPIGNLGAKDTGGMSVYIREIARQLGERGHLVDIYTRIHDPRDRQVYDISQGVRLIHLKAGEDEHINKLAVYSYLPQFTHNVEDFRRDNASDYDLIFSHYWLSGWVGKYLQQLWHVPHITMFHTLGAVKNNIGIGEDEPEIRIATERDLIQNCQSIIAPTTREKENLIRHYDALPEKVSIIPCGVNLELFQPVDRETARQRLGFDDNIIILFAGRIEPNKGLERLLRAMPYLQNGRIPRLVIIGGDENSQQEMERLQKLSRELRVQDSVAFLGLIKQELLPYYYSAADVCVIPSYYESFGLVALESLACGTPVVATDVGDLKSIIHQGETGYVVADNAPHQIADGITLLLSRPPSDISAQVIRASVSSFSWQNVAEAVIGECQRVLADYHTN